MVGPIFIEESSSDQWHADSAKQVKLQGGHFPGSSGGFRGGSRGAKEPPFQPEIGLNVRN